MGKVFDKECTHLLPDRHIKESHSHKMIIRVDHVWSEKISNLKYTDDILLIVAHKNCTQ